MEVFTTVDPLAKSLEFKIFPVRISSETQFIGYFTHLPEAQGKGVSSEQNKLSEV
jgi:hypothetical protein